MNKDSLHSHIINILKEKNRSMTVNEIYESISPHKKINSARPKNTITCVLLRSEYIVRTGIAEYKLK